MRLAGRRHSE